MDGDVGHGPTQEERLGEAVVQRFADAHHDGSGRCRSLWRRCRQGMDDDGETLQ